MAKHVVNRKIGHVCAQLCPSHNGDSIVFILLAYKPTTCPWSITGNFSSQFIEAALAKRSQASASQILGQEDALSVRENFPMCES